jgi:hypothetical protein
MLKKASKSICTSSVVVSPYTFSPTASAYSAMKTPENTEKDLGDPEVADKGYIQMEYFCDQLYSPKYRCRKRKSPVRRTEVGIATT